MKNYSDLLAIKPELILYVDNVPLKKGIHDTIVLDSNKHTTINGIEILPKYQHLSQNGILTIPGPFYSWLHEVSGQGWLLKPT